MFPFVPVQLEDLFKHRLQVHGILRGEFIDLLQQGGELSKLIHRKFVPQLMGIWKFSN